MGYPTLSRRACARLGPIPAGSSAVLLAAGNSTDYVSDTGTTPIFLEFRLTASATGSAQGLYVRLKATGAGSDVNALRAYTNVHNVAGGNAYGGHISLSFGTSGRITGLGCGVRGTLEVPATATSFGGTVCGVQAEIYHAAGGTLANTTSHACLRLCNAGDSTAMDTMLNWMSFAGTNTSNTKTTGTATQTGGLRIWIEGVGARWLMFSTTAPS